MYCTTVLYMCVHHTQGNVYHVSNLHSTRYAIEMRPCIAGLWTVDWTMEWTSYAPS